MSLQNIPFPFWLSSPFIISPPYSTLNHFIFMTFQFCLLHYPSPLCPFNFLGLTRIPPKKNLLIPPPSRQKILISLHPARKTAFSAISPKKAYPASRQERLSRNPPREPLNLILLQPGFLPASWLISC